MSFHSCYASENYKYIGGIIMTKPIEKKFAGKGWGTEVVPKELWIDPSKTYTCGGNPVHGLQIVLHNGNGDEVTFPVKGTIRYNGFPRKKKYTIWTLDGRADPTWGTGDDLVEVKTDGDS